MVSEDQTDNEEPLAWLELLDLMESKVKLVSMGTEERKDPKDQQEHVDKTALLEIPESLADQDSMDPKEITVVEEQKVTTVPTEKMEFVGHQETQD